MDSSIRTGTPLRWRMIEDMRMRKLEHKTQEAYIRAVCKLAAFLRRSPDTSTVEDLRRFQLHLVDRGTSPITLNATLTRLRSFSDVMLHQPQRSDFGLFTAKLHDVRGTNAGYMWAITGRSPKSSLGHLSTKFGHTHPNGKTICDEILTNAGVTTRVNRDTLPAMKFASESTLRRL